ncbi:hypothetical protein ACWEO4_12205 [Streptomyces sp. NPDC004393]|uniref:hypothetical protein n=1 Tax=Streptomyces sp. NPDC004533 TaxID=3154278 RepID=UPI0033A22590
MLLAVLLTWPTARYLTTTIPQDVYDPLLQAWRIAWGGHALTTDPAAVWDTNAFFPEPLSLAYSDSLLGYAPWGWSVPARPPPWPATTCFTSSCTRWPSSARTH